MLLECCACWLMERKTLGDGGFYTRVRGGLALEVRILAGWHLRIQADARLVKMAPPAALALDKRAQSNSATGAAERDLAKVGHRCNGRWFKF